MCDNRGILRRRILRPPEASARDSEPLCNEVPYEEEDTPCACFYGQQWARFQEQSRKPGYVNPFLAMTDDEILATLSRTSENQAAIDAEFEGD
jgi:hypothetical protein